mmetsp:Transcript_18396/g.51285  ORF Transcript_18396/g.51285 Transcript_18396/m.51285 type:complete len:365 (+) Transcript_18396:1104-2198(+)
MHPSSTISCFKVVALASSLESAHLPLPTLSPLPFAVFRAGVFFRVVCEGSIRMYPKHAFFDATEGIVPLRTLSTLIATRFVPSMAISNLTSLPLTNRLSFGRWKKRISLLVLFSSNTAIKPKFRRRTTSFTTPNPDDSFSVNTAGFPSPNFLSVIFRFLTIIFPFLRFWTMSHTMMSPGDGGTSFLSSSSRQPFSNRIFFKGRIFCCFTFFFPLVDAAGFGESFSLSASACSALLSSSLSIRLMQIRPGWGAIPGTGMWVHSKAVPPFKFAISVTTSSSFIPSVSRKTRVFLPFGKLDSSKKEVIISATIGCLSSMFIGLILLSSKSIEPVYSCCGLMDLITPLQSVARTFSSATADFGKRTMR